MLLAKEGQIEFIKNSYHPFFDISIQNEILESKGGVYTNFINFVLNLNDFSTKYDMTKILDFFNQDFSNVVFSSHDNQNIYQYEYHKGLFFIRIHSYKYGVDGPIRMHIIPKQYDASSSKTSMPLLIFKDTPQAVKREPPAMTRHYETRNNETINAYYKESTKKDSSTLYKFNIRDKARDFNVLQINSGYSYNNTNPTTEIRHCTGVLDMSDENGNLITDPNSTEEVKTLIDANYDNVANFSRVITQVFYMQGELHWPHQTVFTEGLNDDTHTIDTVYHKTLKYFNDDLYSEENGHYMIMDWGE